MYDGLGFRASGDLWPRRKRDKESGSECCTQSRVARARAFGKLCGSSEKQGVLGSFYTLTGFHFIP